KQTNGHRSPAYVPEQHGILGIQDVGEAEIPDLGRWPGRDPAGARAGEQRRHRQAYLVHEVGGGQRAHQVRPALGQDPRHPARRDPSSRTGPYPSCRSVPAPTSSASGNCRSSVKTRLSAGFCRPLDSPSTSTAPSTLVTKLIRSPGPAGSYSAVSAASSSGVGSGSGHSRYTWVIVLLPGRAGGRLRSWRRAVLAVAPAAAAALCMPPTPTRVADHR